MGTTTCARSSRGGIPPHLAACASRRHWRVLDARIHATFSGACRLSRGRTLPLGRFCVSSGLSCIGKLSLTPPVAIYYTDPRAERVCGAGNGAYKRNQIFKNFCKAVVQTVMQITVTQISLISFPCHFCSPTTRSPYIPFRLLTPLI